MGTEARQCGALVAAVLLVLSIDAFAQEADLSGLHIHVEQDLFVRPFGLGQDQNYTMGVGIQATGSKFRHVGYPLHLVDQFVTSILPPIRLTPKDRELPYHSLMLVGSAFTPDSLLATEPVERDRPYASLLGLVFSRTWVEKKTDSASDEVDHAISTELGIGFLGLDVSQFIQTWIHDQLGADKPSGWNYQISDGGELTGFYHVSSRRRLTPYVHRDTQKHFGASLDVDLWLGYYTNASLGTTVRLGSFYSRFFEFASAPIMGFTQAQESSVPDGSDLFVFSTVRGRWVLYNALLQGGFRESAYTLSSSEISRAILELELGIHCSINVGDNHSLYATWVALAGRSPEFDTVLSRWHWWGSIQVGITHATGP